MLKKNLCLIMCLLALFLNINSNILIANAETETVQVNVINNPKVDIFLTSSKTQTDLSNFENDIKQLLIKKGIDVSNINFVTIERVSKTFDTLGYSSEEIYSQWESIPSVSNTSVLDGCIVNDMGITVPMKTDDDPHGQAFLFLESYGANKYSIEADILNHGCSAPSGFVLSYDEKTDIGYVLIVGDIYAGARSPWGAYISSNEYGYTSLIKVNNFNKGRQIRKAQHGAVYVTQHTDTTLYTTSTKPYIKQTGTYDKVEPYSPKNIKYWYNNYPNEWYRLKCDIDENGKLDVYINNIFAFSYNLGNINKCAGLFFNCIAATNNVKVTTEKEHIKTYKEVLTEPKWRKDAKHIVVNVDDNIDNTLTGIDTIGEMLSRTLADDIHFVQWGTDTNKTTSEDFIVKNDNKGLFTYSTDYEQAIEDTTDYIISLIEQTTESQYVIVGEDTNLQVTPEELQTGAVSNRFPNGRWIIHHDYTYYENNLGQSSQTEVYTPDLLCNFDKPGKYDIYFDDELIKTVYAHRKPIADFTINISGTNLTLTNESLDLDNTQNIGYGPGIAKETWYYKEVNDTEWTKGKLDVFDKTKIYMIKLEVEDFQGAVSNSTKYTGVGNPVATFNYTSNTISKYSPLTITDTSYDPSGYDITSWNWTLYKNNSKIATYTTKEPIINFNTSTLGAGEYKYTLTVTNNQGATSEPYTQSFTVTDDTEAPEVLVTPTFCEDVKTQDIDLIFSDTDSGFSKWRYVFTEDQVSPSEGWSEYKTNDTDTLTVNTDGYWYLHIEALDVAGNLLQRTVGIYKIRNEHSNEYTSILYGFNGEGPDYNGKGFIISSKSDNQLYNEWLNPSVDKAQPVPNGCEIKSVLVNNSTSYNYNEEFRQISGDMDIQINYYPIDYKITYNLAGGKYNEGVSNPETYNIFYGITFKEPVRDGYKFLGWYDTNGNKLTGINEGLTPSFTSTNDLYNQLSLRTTGNMSLTAKWEPIIYANTYKHYVTGFDGDGNANNGQWYLLTTTIGKKAMDSTFTPDESYALTVPNGCTLQTSYKSNYANGSTYENIEMGTQLTQPSRVVDNEFYYVPNTYTITYDLDGGKYVDNAGNPGTYNVLYGFDLVAPKKPGYAFLGWYDQNGNKIDQVNTDWGTDFVNMQDLYNKLNDRITGDLHLTAKWELSDLVLTAQADNEANGKLGAINLDWSTYDNYNIIFKGYSSKDNGTSWESISLMDYTSVTSVKVLNVYNPSYSGAANLKGWMQAYGKGIILVDQVTVSNFNNNPNGYLKDTNGNWKYDVLFFGSNDFGFDLNATSEPVVESFIKSGRGVICGHDNMVQNCGGCVHPYFWKLARYFGLSTSQSSYNYYSTKSSRVKILKKGLFTSYPYEIGDVGTVLSIPESHMNGQIVTDGINWLSFINTPTSISNTNYISYLVTKNNCAMIQTGHANGQATSDEQKIIANLIFYCYQLSSETSIKDNGAMDTTGPSKPNITVNDLTYNFTSTERGTSYKHYIEAYDKSNMSTPIQTSNITTTSVISGMKEYRYLFDNSANTVLYSMDGSATKSSSITSAQNSSNARYLHVIAIDNAGNASETATIDLKANVTVNHYVINKTTRTYPSSPTYVDTTMQIINSNYAAPVRSISGYASPDVQTVKVKADGTTTVNYYYDVYKHTIYTYIDKGYGALSEDQKVEHGCNSSVYYYPANGYDVEYVRYGTSNSNLTDTPIDILKVFENVQSNYYFHVSYKITDTKKSEITKSTYNWIDLKLQ